MNYASVCDGIGAAHVAWQPLGWECRWTSEIEPFPAEVVRQRWGFQNYGDALLHDGAVDALPFMRWEDEGAKQLELIVSGTPCQSFSVAGLRQGLKDPRGGLMLTFVEIAQRYRPRWLVWENVPGVLSSDGGRDFGALLGALGHLGYGWAYRVLDAQWFGVAQRRRRVFLVGCIGEGRSASAVLFERESVCRDHPPQREEVKAHPSSNTARRTYECGIEAVTIPGHASIPFAKSRRAQSSTDDETWIPGDVAPTLNCFDQGDTRATVAVVSGLRVRRLTTREWERLQGFPDDYTAIVFQGRPAADGPRYKAIGNSMAVPVMRWIGERIAMVETKVTQ